MNRILQIIIILLFISGCNSKKDELQQNWIGKYSVHHADTEDESISSGLRSIFKFEKDSVRIKNFYFDFLTDTNDVHSIKYYINKDLILLIEEGKKDTFNYELSKGSLSLNYSDSYARRSVFEKMPEYDLANKESEFYELLVSSSFEIFDSVRVEFRDNSRLIIPNFDFSFGDNQFWMIDKYEGELFLVVDGFFGFVLQVSKINTDSFKGIIYGNQNKEIVFKKLSNEAKFKIEELNGEWVEFIDENISLPPRPPIFDEERDFFEREQLYFGDSIIIKKKFFRIDTIKWETNREQDLILLPELDLPIRKKKWKIISLDDKKLTIDRIPRIRNMNGNQIERKIFERK
jgi:hypothetical protein